MPEQPAALADMLRRHGSEQEEIRRQLVEIASSLRTLGDQMHFVARQLESAASVIHTMSREAVKVSDLPKLAPDQSRKERERGRRS
jgi:hypothetical protein